MFRHPSLRRPTLSLVILVAGAVTMGALAAGAAAGLRVNMTASMPRGLWWLRTGAPIARGTVVAICPPNRVAIRRAVRRGYMSAGPCPGGFEPLLKPVAALGGDLVTVGAAGVAVSGTAVANTRPLASDEAGRALVPVPPGSHRVPPGAVWLLSGHDRRSFDSRYFGDVPSANIIGVARPVWVLP